MTRSSTLCFAMLEAVFFPFMGIFLTAENLINKVIFDNLDVINIFIYKLILIDVFINIFTNIFSDIFIDNNTITKLYRFKLTIDIMHGVSMTSFRGENLNIQSNINHILRKGIIIIITGIYYIINNLIVVNSNNNITRDKCFISFTLKILRLDERRNTFELTVDLSSYQYSFQTNSTRFHKYNIFSCLFFYAFFGIP